MCGSQASTCASTSSSTSEGENCLARKPAIRSVAERSCSEVTASCVAVLCMGAYRKSGFNDAGKDAGADRQNFVIEHVARIVHGNRAVMADPEVGAGDRFHHVGKILAAHLWLGAGKDFRRIDHSARDLFDHARLLLLVDQYAENVADVGLDLALERGRHAGADRAHALANERT